MKGNSENKEIKIESLPTEESNRLNQEKISLNIQGYNLITQRKKKSNLKVNSSLKEKKTVHFRGVIIKINL